MSHAALAGALGACKFAGIEDSPGQDFYSNDKTAESGGELGPGDMDKNQFGSDSPLESPQAFHLEQALDQD